jgi:uncharacterized membrane protein
VNTAQERAKRPASIVAGPYGHPFHATLVPVPIGAFVGVLVLDLVSKSAQDGAGYARAATVLLGVGLVGAALAAIFGFMDYTQIARRTKANRVATTHMILNLLVVVVLLGSFLGRIDSDTESTPTGHVVVMALALAVLGVSGWLGGKMSYHYGIRVADEATQAEAFEERGGLLPESVSSAGRVDRVPGTNVPTGKRR